MILAAYGMRVGELNHLLFEDVDFDQQIVRIRSKPEMLWWIKTRRTRDLPLTPETAGIVRKAIGKRKFGFVFLNDSFVSGESALARTFADDPALRLHLKAVRKAVVAANPVASQRDCLRAVTAFCRSIGQIPSGARLSHRLRQARASYCPILTGPPMA